MPTKLLQFRKLNSIFIHRNKARIYLTNLEPLNFLTNSNNFSTNLAQLCSSSKSKTSQSNVPSEVYKERVEAGVLTSDPHQLRVMEKFDLIQKSLENYTPPSKQSAVGKLFGSFFTGNSSGNPKGINIPKGLYIYGAVGGGKTMIMDLFHEVSAVGGNKKRRVHFHSFMSDAHTQIHRVKQDTAFDSSSGTRPKVYDPIPPVAGWYIRKTWFCLCSKLSS